MNDFTIPGMLLLFTVVFGFWLSIRGKPYNSILFNIHKLIALSVVIICATQLSKWIAQANSATVVIALFALAGVGVAALFASGALMSAGKLSYRMMLTIHRAGSITAVIALALVVFQLLGKV